MDPLGYAALVDLKYFWVIVYQCSANDNSELRSYEFGIFIPSMIPCVTEKFWVIVFALTERKRQLGIQLTGNSEFADDTKLLLSPWVDVIYTNLVYP